MTNITSTEYIDFVQQTTSPASSDFVALVERMNELNDEGVKLTHLLTFCLGMIGELGESVDLIKKTILQGKEMTPDLKARILSEGQDLLWYLAQFCIAMDVSFEDLMQGNYEKLSSRYPEGHFSVYRSENRRLGDD